MVRLKVNVLGVVVNGGNIYIVIYWEAIFLQDEFVLFSVVVLFWGKVEVSGQLEVLFYNIYVVVVFQDMNGNDQLDKNVLGIFMEFYVFFNNLIVKWWVLMFNDVVVLFNQVEQVILIILKYWKDY